MSVQLNQVHCMDCLKGMAELQPGSVDLAFADPPFNIGYDYDVYDDRKEANAYLKWSKDWMAAIAWTLKPDGAFWLAIGDEYAAELKVIATRELGLTCRNWVVWYYTFGVHCKAKFTRSHAHLFYFVKDAKKFTFNDGAIRVPSARQLVYADRRADARGRLPDDTWILRPQDLPEGFQADEDTWYFPRVCGTFKERKGWHGCQMPEQLLGRIIKACSNEGEVVLDPFGGSGTTLAVAKKLGRKFIGFELSKEYAANIETRLADIQPGMPLDGSEQPATSSMAPPTAMGRALRSVAQPPDAKVPTAIEDASAAAEAQGARSRVDPQKSGDRIDLQNADSAPRRKPGRPPRRQSTPTANLPGLFDFPAGAARTGTD